MIGPALILFGVLSPAWAGEAAPPTVLYRGDLNNDGFGDFVTGSYMFLGEEL